MCLDTAKKAKHLTKSSWSPQHKRSITDKKLVFQNMGKSQQIAESNSILFHRFSKVRSEVMNKLALQDHLRIIKNYQKQK